MADLPAEDQQVLAEHPALRLLLEKLVRSLQTLQQENQQLREQVKRLEDRLKLDSHNSSKPPSSDAFPVSQKPILNLRTRSGKKPGGQEGHPGSTLERVSVPDRTVVHPVGVCSGCGKDLSGVEATQGERRQVFDLPEKLLEVTEHQSEVKVCPECQTVNRGVFPEGVDHPVQYGARVKSLAVYLSEYQMIPFGRVSELFEDVVGQSLSQGTLLNALSTTFDHLAPTEAFIQQGVVSAPVAHFDETGVKVAGQGQWLHTASTPAWTYYAVHRKRGREGMDAAGILPSYRGVAEHDHWEPYLGYQACVHAFCNAHHLRELMGVLEHEGAPWAAHLIELLLEIKAQVDAAKQAGQEALPWIQRAFYQQCYHAILLEGGKIYAAEEEGRAPPKRGRKKRSKGHNLLLRLERYSTETLRFMEDFRVPFDNNLVERDIRMVKVKQKVSGCFRSEEGTRYFCRIRGFISTVKKQQKNVLEELTRALQLPHPKAILLAEPQAV